MDSNHNSRFLKQNRLPDAASFSRVFDRPKRSRDRFFTVLCRDNGAKVARLGLAVSKKHARRAVERNRIKRVIRESFRDNKLRLEGLDVVVMNQPATHTATNETLYASLDAHWARCAGACVREKA